MSVRDGVQIKATLVSRSGPAWEQQLLSQHKQRVLVSVQKNAPISVLKDKLTEKFTSSNIAKLNADESMLRSLGIERITGAKITALHTADGYDIDEDTSLDELFGSYADVVLEVQAEVDLLAIQVQPMCCGLM